MVDFLELDRTLSPWTEDFWMLTALSRPTRGPWLVAWSATACQYNSCRKGRARTPRRDRSATEMILKHKRANPQTCTLFTVGRSIRPMHLR